MPLVALSLWLSPGKATAHESFLEPVSYQVPAGGAVVADIRVGQLFKGGAHLYIPSRFRRLDYALGDRLEPVPGRMGDRPAVSAPALGEGLHVVVYASGDNRLRYDDFSKFRDFVRHKDAAWTLEAHAARGLPQEGFGEIYSRHAKTLVAVGHGRGADRRFGLETEIVALANPYTDDLSEGLPVQLFYQGAPRENAQIEVFAKDGEGEVEVFTVRTDESGIARVSVTPGRSYMLDAVVLREPPADSGAEWESLWANLTFAVPATR